MSFVKGELPYDKIVDRVRYIDELNQILKNNSGVILIKAATGIGKSSIVTKFLGELDKQQYCPIRIRTNKRNSNSSNSEWDFFNTAVSILVNSYNDNPELSFNAFFRTSKERRRWLYQIVSSMTNINDSKTMQGIKIICFLALYLLRINCIEYNEISDRRDSTSQNIKLSYFEFVMKNSNKMIICIDNLQNIDDNSFRIISKIISLAKKYNHFLLFEYTSSKDNTEDYNILCENIKATGISVNEIIVEYINKESIIDVVENATGHPIPTASCLSKRIIETYEKTNNGNIQNMIDYYIQNKERDSPIVNLDDNTLSNMLSLSSDSMNIIGIIINFGKPLNEGELEIVLRLNGCIFDICACEQELTDKGIVIKINGCYSIKHASMVDCWTYAVKSENNKVLCADSFACSALEQFYNIRIKNDTSGEGLNKYLIGLLNVYSKSDPVKIKELLKYMKETVFKSISISQLTNFCEEFITVAINDIRNNINVIFEIIQIYFSCELYTMCLNCINRIEGKINDDRIILYKAMLYSALDRHIDNIAHYEQYIKVYRNNAYIYYNLKLIVLASYRSLNRLDKCYAIDKELVTNMHFIKMIEYGYYLRLSEMYMNRDVSIKNLKKSCNLFKKYKNYKQYGKSLISYAFVTAVLGNLHHALKLINKAEKSLKGYTVGAHMFKVNKAAIYLYKRRFGKETWELLDEAEQTAVVPFDKLAIIINKLVLCYENDNYTFLNALENYGNDLIRVEPDRHIHALFYYNLYLIYLKQNNEQKQKHYYELAQRNKDACRPVLARLNKQTTPETRFVLKYRWHVCFLAYWTYDILDNNYNDE